MSDEMKNNVAHWSAWFAAIIGTVSFEVWLGVAGFAVSAFIAFTNYRSRKLQDRLLLEEAKRSAEMHTLEMERLRLGINIPPAVSQSSVKDLVAETAAAKTSS